MRNIAITTYVPGTPLDCGHTAPDQNTVAFDTITGKSMCYACSDRKHRDELLSLPVGGNHVAYAQLPAPYGHAKLLPGVAGQVTTWTGGVIGQVVPGSIKEQRLKGFNDSRGVRYHFRVVVQDEDASRIALFYATGPGDGLLVTLKRMVDRKHPLDVRAAHPKTKEGTRIRGYTGNPWRSY